MPNRLSKNLRHFFSKRKRSSTSQSPSNSHTTNDDSRTTKSILSNNFSSLSDLTSDSTSKSINRATDDVFSLDPTDPDGIPDFSTIFASQRFFFSPGHSNSIIELQPECSPESETLVSRCVPVPTYSMDPYVDFRVSMQEMVEARGLLDVKSDWDQLHQLLLCYFALNPKHTHKFIIAAFADLLINLMMPTDGSRRDSEVSSPCKVSGRVHSRSSTTDGATL